MVSVSAQNREAWLAPTRKTCCTAHSRSRKSSHRDFLPTPKRIIHFGFNTVAFASTAWQTVHQGLKVMPPRRRSKCSGCSKKSNRVGLSCGDVANRRCWSSIPMAVHTYSRTLPENMHNTGASSTSPAGGRCSIAPTTGRSRFPTKVRVSVRERRRPSRRGPPTRCS